MLIIRYWPLVNILSAVSRVTACTMVLLLPFPLMLPSCTAQPLHTTLGSIGLVTLVTLKLISTSLEYRGKRAKKGKPAPKLNQNKSVNIYRTKTIRHQIYEKRNKNQKLKHWTPNIIFISTSLEYHWWLGRETQSEWSSEYDQGQP